MTWPFENDTSAIVKKLAGRSMQADKRNKAFLLLTIAISVCMVFSILLISTGTQEKFKNTQRNKAQIGILGVTDEQTAQLHQNENITWVGEYSALGVFYVENKTITVAYGNEDYFLHQEEKTFQGSVPQKADEIMLPQNYLDFLGKSYQTGDTISIDLTGTGQKAEYTLSGVLNNTKESNGYFIYVSKELAQDLAKDSFQVTAYTRLNTDAISSTAILDFAGKAIQNTGIVEEQVMLTEYSAVMSGVITSGIPIPVPLLAALTAILAATIVYGVFYTKIVKNVQMFGQLRTVGMTKRQIKRMASKEGRLYALAGIPLGLVIGVLIGFIGCPDGFRLKTTVIYAVLIAAVAFVTVNIAIFKPVRVAMNTSPVEGAKYLAYAGKAKSSSKLHRKLTPFNLAKINIQIRKEKDSGAAGIQRGRDAINYFCMEYPGNQGKYVMTYNSKNGRFSGILKTEEKNEKLPGIREGKNTGEQYLALLAYANLVPDNPLFNEEFQKNFYILEEQEKKEWEDKEAALRAAFICCDAMYCEVIANPQQAIPLEKSQFRAEELEDVLPEYKIAAGVYAPNDEIYGKFHVLLPVNEKTKRTLFELKQIYSGRWDVNERTKERIPSLPEDYLVSKEAEEILQMVDKTPARLFMLTGDAGTGKTTDARMIAQILGLPYYVFTCGPGTDELELLATTVPNMGGTAHLEMELPRLEDIEMDPASALATVNGIYEEGISREKAFQEILKAVYEKGYEKSKNEKDFLLKESEIVKACREPSVIEIQEPAMIEKPGTLTRLNSLFDDGAVTDLVNGEQIRRNPDTIVIMTTNLDYVGCQNFNQSVLSRMNLIQPKEALTEEEMAKRAMKRTGFKNKELLSFMAATVCKIHEYLIEQDITDGVCGYRELENWVLSYMVSNDLRRSAWTALLSKASMDREERGTMERVFLLPHCDVD